MDTDDEKGLPDDSTAEAAEAPADAEQSGGEDVLPAGEPVGANDE